jgi:predicted DNA-binding transcriptional regulator AlpA
VDDEQVYRLWGVKDVASFLGVPVMTIYYWRRNDCGPQGRRVGRYLRYRPKEVRAWFDEQGRIAG